MSDVISRQPGWMPWTLDRTVEYQIADDFLRIRRWEQGAARTSSWTRWERSTDETVRKLLRELEWDLLPKHAAHVADHRQNGGWRHHLSNWLRNHFIAG